jgi:ribonuclease Z
MVDILFLGTACMQPTKERNHPGVLLSYKGEKILFDCGEGIQRQLKLAGVKPAKISKVLISHWHGDHVLGLPGLMSTMGADQFAKRLQIYGPKGSKKYVEFMLKAFLSTDVIEHEVIEVEEGVIFENEDYYLESYSLKHPGRCVGFSFIEKDKLRIKVKEAEKMGLSGEILGDLQKKKKVVFKGKKIDYKDVTYTVRGKKISYIADTRPCEGASELASGSDLVISESTYSDADRIKAKEHMHLTAKEAAMIASESGAEKLILTHISQRYKNPLMLEEEAREIFDNVLMAKDFMKVKV